LLVSGISGLLGLNAALQWRDVFDLAGCYLSHPVAVPGVEAVRLDVEDRLQFLNFVQQFRPHMIFHSAGLTNVDRCELEPALAHRLNVEVTRNVAEAAQSSDARLVHVSTDHLFAGHQQFYGETAEPQPINAYARTKLEAERVVEHLCPDALIIRTNFLGWGTSIRSSLTDWILSSLASAAPFNMFTDVFITPILINDLLDCIRELLDRNVSGVLNVAGSERVSKYEVGIRTARWFGYSTEQIHPISVEHFPFVAPRPRDMSLATGRVSALLGRQMPNTDAGLARLRHLRDTGWPAALDRAIQEGSEAAQVLKSPGHTGRSDDG
jgi:dTDP-4-dehydrorhamnose reductase